MGGSVIVVDGHRDWESCHERSKSKNMLLVIDFTATWCGPCRIIGPTFEKLSTAYPNAIFAKVDVDKNGDIAQQFGVGGIPAFHFYKGGSKVDELVGADANRLEMLVKKHYTQGNPAFHGQGQKLGGTSTSAAATPASASQSSLPAPPVDDSLPVTSLQLKLPDGSRHVFKFNTCSPIATLRDYIAKACPSLPPTFQLLANFPPRPVDFSDPSTTVAVAGLLNASLSVKA